MISVALREAQHNGHP